MGGSMNGAPIFMVLICLALAGGSGAEVRVFKWTVEYQKWSPDCANVGGTQVITINGSFPGPTIRAHVGDTIVVNLTNNLHTGEGVVIHWHGIQQRGTPWFDGTASISQCPIQAGKSFEYRFDVEKPGTFFYHGHYGMQRSAGLYGSLIVDVPKGQKEPFDETDELPEFNLLLSDWWHKSAKQQEEELSSRNFVWIGEPQAILVNGKGQSDCSWESVYDNHSPAPSPSPTPSLPLSRRGSCKFTGDENCGVQSLKVVPNKTYRLRLASSTALASLNLQIQNHTMKVVEADGNYVKPFEVVDMDIYSGESYSVLFTTNQNPNQNYWISLSVRGRKPNTTQSLTLLNYLPTPSSHLPASKPPIPPLWNNDTHSKNFSESIFAPKDSQLKPPDSEANRTLILLNTQNIVDGYKKWAINNVSLLLPEKSAILKSVKEGLKGVFDHDTSPPDNLTLGYDLRKQAPNPNAKNSSGVYKIEKGHVVDVILQNANALDAGVSEIHPWHLHGHDFWVLGYGNDKFTEKDKKSFNLKNPPLRNTVVIFPYGWTAIRFVADNPGVWAFHCHIEPHLHMGMGVVFAEAAESIGTVPPEALVCETSEKIVAINNGDRRGCLSSLFSLFSALDVIFIICH